jgi:hypothetical protein
MESGVTLEELQKTVIVNVAGALSAVRLLALAAPFCDPALTIVTQDLEDALSAGRQARMLTEQLSRVIAVGPVVPPTADER